jgi:hypothetical protein
MLRRAAGEDTMRTMECSEMYVMAQIASERTRDNLELAQQLQYSRRMRTLRRASRMEHKAERRMIEAWRRAAELRSGIESLDY